MHDEMIFRTDLEGFNDSVIRTSFEIPVLVDFWADWCPPCVSLEPVLNQVVKQLAGKARLAKVEVDEGENMKLAGSYQLRGFPTVLLFIHGEERGRFSGFRSAEHIRSFLADHGVNA